MSDFSLRLSRESRGVLGIAGHVGVGHVHSHSGFVQDDSAGFAVTASIVREIIQADTRIRLAEADPYTGIVSVETYGGGVGRASARRGITPMEAALMKSAIDEDGIYTQRAALKLFGRMYGQGVHETAVALQGAVALAVMDTFLKKEPSRFHAVCQDVPGLLDKAAGIVIDVDGIPVSVMMTVNCTEGGIGPVEDYEGNVAEGGRRRIMEEIGLISAPTVIVESKAFIPSIARSIKDSTFLVRAQEGVDNSAVASALVEAAGQLGIECLFAGNTLPQVKGQLAGATSDFADRVIALGNKLKGADSSYEKVRLIADLAKLISEDAGGISFMSNSLHERVRGAGMEPGTSAVISLLVPKEYRDFWKIPVLEPHDIEQYRSIILQAIILLNKNRGRACEELKQKSGLS